MKKAVVAFLFLCVLRCAYAHSVDDTCVSFSTRGPDRYSDGSVVLDGECYALVYSGDGVFEGFTADGKCIDEEDRVILIAPVARDGRCPPVLFQFSPRDMDLPAGGRYSVFLLDTRLSENGAARAAGSTGGALEFVNGYAAVTATVKPASASERISLKESATGGNGQVARNVAQPPPSARQPKIKSMRVDGDLVTITVENLGGYMRVQSGKDVKSFTSTGPATRTSGAAGETTLSAQKPGSSGFFRVLHND